MESLQKAGHQTEATPKTKERSTIAFPYFDLDSAVEVVNGVHNAGGTACDLDQLAAQLNMEAKGGGFRMRVNGAQTFGLLQYERGGRVVLTDLGREIIDSANARHSRMKSFLAVELFAKVYEEFKGGPLPPQAGLERSIIKMGVGKNVADRARQALLRSAKQAGFFEQAADRLIKPSTKLLGNEQNINGAPKGDAPPNNGGNGGGGDEHHPLIKGLLVTLPKPSQSWSMKDRMNWLIMANSIFKAIYSAPEADTQEISIKIAGDENK